MNARLTVTTLVSIALAACATPSRAVDQPAVVVSPSDASRASLQQAVSTALTRPVTLADDAFTRDSTLVIERAATEDPTGRRIEARERGMPQKFHLVKRGEMCVLIHDDSGRESQLSHVICSATR